MRPLVLVSSVLIVLVHAGAPAARAASVQELFERYGLLGTFAADCAKPMSRQNTYIVHRVLDAHRIQREAMSEPGKVLDTSTIDLAATTGPDSLDISLGNERRRLQLTLRVEGTRWRVMDSAREGGEKLVANGRAVDDGSEMPWLNKCR